MRDMYGYRFIIAQQIRIEPSINSVGNKTVQVKMEDDFLSFRDFHSFVSPVFKKS